MLNDIYQHLDPTAFSIGSFAVQWYSLAYLAGFLFAGIWMHMLARHWNLKLSSDDVMSIVVGIGFGAIIGGRLFYVIFYNGTYYLEHPLHIFYLREGGMSFHGGLVGALIGGYLACKLLRLSFATVADLAFCAAPMGLFFGRLANFVNGELWGKPTDLPWGVVFASGGNVPRHPSQLYEALLEGLLLFLILFVLSRKTPPHPQHFFMGVFLLGYGLFRFLVEFIRLPDEQLGYLMGNWLTMGQVLTLPLIFLGIVFIGCALKAQRPQRTYLQEKA